MRLCRGQITDILLLNRYTLPIGAVDTHRPKPGSGTIHAQIGTGREYYGDNQ